MAGPGQRTSIVLESFRRIRGEALVERFYERFLATDERIRAMFAQTDFVRQKQMVQHGILMILNFANGDPIGSLALKRLGQRHSKELRVTADMYKTFIDCMTQAAADLDPQWNSRLERAWRDDLEIGIAEMQRL
jgi:hemoglobin-like flavoprotein